MSEEFVSGCIQHKDTRHVRLYCDYMDIYKGNEHKAKIIRILETWTNSKRAEWLKENLDRLEQGEIVKEPDFWITMSYAQFKQFMYSSTGSSEDTLKKNLAELEKARHITRRVNPDFPYGPPQYLLNTKTVQAALNKRAAPPLIPELPQYDTPPGNFLPPQEVTPTQGVELPPPRGEDTHLPGGISTPTQGGKTGTSNNGVRITNESPKNAAKEREGVSANASTPPAFSSSSDEDAVLTERFPDGNLRIYRKSGKPIGELIPIGTDTSEGLRELITVEGSIEEEDETVKHKAVRPNETPYHIATDAIGNEHLDIPGRLTLPSKPAVKLQAVAAGQAPIASLPIDSAQQSTVSEQTPGTVQATSRSLLLDSEPAQADFPPAGSVASGVTTAQASGDGKPEKPTQQASSTTTEGKVTQVKPKRGRRQEVQLTLAEAQLKQWLEEVRETEISLTKRTVTALRSLAARKGADSKEMFLTIVAVLDSDPWFEEHKIGVDFYWIDRQWENKYIFLQRKKPPLADKKPMDIYTQASLDPERNQRRIDKMKQKAAQQGHTF